MEFKLITPEEWLLMFPKIKLTNWAKEEFIKTCKLTRVVKLKNTKKFRPIFENNIGSYYFKNKQELYLHN